MTTDQSKSWILSFELKPLGVVEGFNNILRFTTFAEYKYPLYGDRMPAIWFWSKSTRLHIWNSVNGKLIAYNDDKNLPQNEFTHIELKQILDGSNQYVFSIHIGGIKVYEVLNKDARNWNNVHVWLSDPWSPAAKAVIKNFVFKNFVGGKYTEQVLSFH